MASFSLGLKATKSMLFVSLGWLVQIACALIVIYFLVKAVWFFAFGPDSNLATTNLAATPQTQSKKVNLHKILNTDLFGSVNDEEATIKAEKLKETTLNLDLMGTVLVADDRALSSAFIKNRGGSQKSREYNEGDAVASYAKVEEIHSRFVVISRGGEHERLTFTGDKIFRQEPPRTQVRVSPQSNQPSPRQVNKQEFEASVEQHLSTNSLEDLKQLGLAEVQTTAGPSLEIVDTDGTSPLSRLGMQPGDIVLSVNGHSLASLRRNQTLTQEILGTGQARLLINRGGREFQLTVPMPK